MLAILAEFEREQMSELTRMILSHKKASGEAYCGAHGRLNRRALWDWYNDRERQTALDVDILFLLFLAFLPFSYDVLTSLFQ